MEPRRGTLALRAAVRLVMALIVFSAIFFMTAGTTDWWQAKVYMTVLFTAVGTAFVMLLVRDPALLERRLRRVEKRREQQLVQVLGSVVYLGVFVVPGLDRRFGWSIVPDLVVVAADVLVVAGYALFVQVLRFNSWASRLIEVEDGQRVVKTGPYAVVRHPMYSAILVIFLVTPVALGSWWALIPAVLLGPILAVRIRGEEALLCEKLQGYAAYTLATRYRLAPGIW
jgi:protein-S-isoprenylcysteine O-methyltransferase Ste14